MSAIDKLLSRLQRVKRTGPGRWMASSPTREDRRPSLAIRQLDDGRILIHDFGGDDVAAILAAVGLELIDLFPDRAGPSGDRVARPFSATDVLSLVQFESSVAVMVCSDVLRNKVVSEADFDRLMTAARRLADAAEVCHVYR